MEGKEKYRPAFSLRYSQALVGMGWGEYYTGVQPRRGRESVPSKSLRHGGWEQGGSSGGAILSSSALDSSGAITHFQDGQFEDRRAV